MNWRGAAERVLREPLVHFLLIGALVFAVFGEDGAPQDRRIVIDSAQVERLAAGQRWRGAVNHIMAGEQRCIRCRKVIVGGPGDFSVRRSGKQASLEASGVHRQCAVGVKTVTKSSPG